MIQWIGVLLAVVATALLCVSYLVGDPPFDRRKLRVGSFALFGLFFAHIAVSRGLESKLTISALSSVCAIAFILYAWKLSVGSRGETTARRD